ncbi:replication protein, partial [Streptomyces sp. G35A]
METARADQKTGRGRKSMVPFQMLYRLWDIEVAGLDPDAAEGYGTAAQCRIWWAEYEDAMAGRRAIEWTRGLRGHVHLDGDDSEESDLQYVYEPQAEPLTGGVVLTADAHSTVVRADAELDVEATVRTECYDSAADVVEALGGRAGHVRVATAEELAELQENMFARLQARREERERQVRIMQFEADQAATEREKQQLPVARPATA